jgi:hypothetical protein
MKLSKSLFLFGLAASLLAVAPAKATTINWGTYVSFTGSLLYDSSGNNLDDNYFFELGSFGSFTPTSANMADWLANWKPFDRAYAPATWNSAVGNVSASATLETDFTTDNATLSQANTFAEGDQAYIWVYRDVAGNPTPSPAYDIGLEWALVTNDSSDTIVADDWTFPAPSGHIVANLDWRIEDASTVIFGGLNDGQGPGTYSVTPGSFALQTHTDPTAVPEPGSLLLISAVGSVFALRRKRRSAQSV